MRIKTKTIIIVTAIALVIGIATPLALAYWPNQQRRGDYFSDFALFDTTYPDEVGAACKVTKRIFEFYVVAQAYGGSATIRVTFADGAYIDFRLAEDEILSFQQSAGGTIGVDDEIKVTVEEGDAVGWISIRTQKGAVADKYEPYNGNFCITLTETE